MGTGPVLRSNIRAPPRKTPSRWAGRRLRISILQHGDRDRQYTASCSIFNAARHRPLLEAKHRWPPPTKRNPNPPLRKSPQLLRILLKAMAWIPRQWSPNPLRAGRSNSLTARNHHHHLHPPRRCCGRAATQIAVRDDRGRERDQSRQAREHFRRPRSVANPTRRR
jgi:hypothetical protein